MSGKKCLFTFVLLFFPLICLSQTQISTPADLDLMRGSSGKFVLTADLDMTGIDFVPIQGFKGSLDGQNHVISNLKIISTSDSAGLFSGINGKESVIQNLGFDNAFIIGKQAIGTLAGQIRNFKSIKNCFVINSVIIASTNTDITLQTAEQYMNNTSIQVGGLIGNIMSSVSAKSCIENCFTENNIIKGLSQIGGIVGRVSNSISFNSCYEVYCTITVKNPSESGNTYGGIVAESSKTLTLNECWYEDKEGITSPYGEKKSAQQILDEIKSTCDMANMLIEDYFATTGHTNSLILKSAVSEKDIFVKSVADISSVDFFNQENPYPYPSSLTIDIPNGGRLIGAENLKSGTPVNIISDNLTAGSWNLVGSMSKNSDFGIFNNNTYNYDVAAVDFLCQGSNATNDWNTQYLTSANPLNDGEGYFVYMFSSHNLNPNEEIENPENSAELNIYIPTSSENFYKESIRLNKVNDASNETGGNQQGYWFSFANPFLFDLDLSDLIAENADIVGGNFVYVFIPSVNDEGKAVGDWNDEAVQYVKPGQGFMIYAPNDTKTVDLTFDYGQRKVIGTANNQNKSCIKTRKFDFTAISSDKKRCLSAVENPKASNGFDNGDAYVLISSNDDNLVTPYFAVDKKKVFKNEFKDYPFTADLNFHSNNDAFVSFYLNNSYKDITVSLIDKDNGNEEFILTENQPYDFFVKKGENQNRFKIKFFENNNTPQEEIVSDEDLITITNDKSNIKVCGNNLRVIEVYNTVGQKLFSKEINADEYLFDLNQPSGAYIVSVKNFYGGGYRQIVVF